MNDKFGQFEWKCYKDTQPEPQRFVYTYFPDYQGLEATTSGVDISIAEDVNWDDEDYWCYVFIPDAPKIEKEMKLEDRVDKLELSVSRLETLLYRLLPHLPKV